MKYNYPPLTGICKEAIEKGLCLGCVGLAENDWIPPRQCKLIQEKENWVQEKIKL